MPFELASIHSDAQAVQQIVNKLEDVLKQDTLLPHEKTNVTADLIRAKRLLVDCRSKEMRKGIFDRVAEMMSYRLDNVTQAANSILEEFISQAKCKRQEIVLPVRAVSQQISAVTSNDSMLDMAKLSCKGSKNNKDSSGKSTTPEDLKRKIDDLGNKAMEILKDLIDPEMQRQLRDRMAKASKEQSTAAKQDLERYMHIASTKIETSRTRSSKTASQMQQEIEVLTAQAEKVLKDLKDPKVAKQLGTMLQGLMAQMMSYTPQELEKCKKITEEQLQKNPNKERSNIHYVTNIVQSFECKTNPKTGKEECTEKTETKKEIYDCPPNTENKKK